MVKVRNRRGGRKGDRSEGDRSEKVVEVSRGRHRRGQPRFSSTARFLWRRDVDARYSEDAKRTGNVEICGRGHGDDSCPRPGDILGFHGCLRRKFRRDGRCAWPFYTAICWTHGDDDDGRRVGGACRGLICEPGKSTPLPVCQSTLPVQGGRKNLCRQSDRRLSGVRPQNKCFGFVKHGVRSRGSGRDVCAAVTSSGMRLVHVIKTSGGLEVDDREAQRILFGYNLTQKGAEP